jgi:hypothetical protein
MPSLEDYLDYFINQQLPILSKVRMKFRFIKEGETSFSRFIMTRMKMLFLGI